MVQNEILAELPNFFKFIGFHFNYLRYCSIILLVYHEHYSFQVWLIREYGWLYQRPWRRVCRCSHLKPFIERLWSVIWERQIWDGRTTSEEKMKADWWLQCMVVSDHFSFSLSSLWDVRRVYLLDKFSLSFMAWCTCSLDTMF